MICFAILTRVVSPQIPIPPGDRHPLGDPIGLFGDGVYAPSILERTEPEYSHEARIARLNGTVVLSVVVGEDGRTRDMMIKRSLGLGLDEQALATVGAWRFKPGKKDGSVVPVHAAQIELDFHLPTEPGSWYLRRAQFDTPAGADRPLVLKSVYPEAVAGGGVDATLSFTIDANGRPQAVSIDTSSSASAARELRKTLESGWQFKPAMMGGSPVAARCTFEFARLSKF